MEKRLILAISLSILIIISFQYLFVKQRPAAPLQAPVTAAPQGDRGLASTIAITVRQQQPAEEKEFQLDSGKYKITFSDVGGSIKDIKLKDFKDRNSGDPMALVSLKNPRDYLLSMERIGSQALLNNVRYSMVVKGNIISYSLKQSGLEITKEYTIPNHSNYIELRIITKNISASPESVSYGLVSGSGLSETNAQDARFIETVTKISGKAERFKQPKNGERILHVGNAEWVELKNKYFSLILKPFTSTRSAFCYKSTNDTLTVGVDTEPVILNPGFSVEQKFLLYAGPSSLKELKAVGYGLDETVNYGFFGAISKVLLVVAGFMYTIFRNWGVAIIFLAIFLNLILFPLTVKSLKSMHKMQELHPQMEKLKVQFKGDPQKLNKEIMELYKKYNINPLSGCLPMILQMPIFIALYNALIKSVELRGAGFLWVKDLSLPDAVGIPFTLPLIGNSINILPLLMIVGMVVQQKMSTKSMGAAITEEQKQQQKIMLIIMPVMFGFIFYNMPSGLVLYWLVNTILTIVEQYVVLKNM